MPKALAEVNSLLGETKPLPSPILDSHLEAGADWEKICLTEERREPAGKSVYAKPQFDRERFLTALLADHSSFMRDRLSSFVGRVQELKEIGQRITEKQQTGGYVTITGQAGQGKSSIIAKLVEEYGQEQGYDNVAFHFIPFNPGPDHQV